MQKYDIIGDIHGHFSELKALLVKLGYRQGSGSRDHFFHPEGRKVLFIGDYIDRGRYNLKVLSLVKKMADAGTALALMGNHEYNCLAWHQEKDPEIFGTDSGPYRHLRRHTDANRKQAGSTLAEFEKYPAQEEFFLKWMESLPLFLELEGFRAVHACWDFPQIKFMSEVLQFGKFGEAEGFSLKGDFFQKSWKPGSPEYEAVETVLKGKEGTLPDGLKVKGTDGVRRSTFRIKWWMTPQEILNAGNIEEISLLGKEKSFEMPDSGWFENSRKTFAGAESYGPEEKPVFIGHYWFTGEPEPLTSNIACVDYSVASGGTLTAYRWDGEKELKRDKFTCL